MKRILLILIIVFSISCTWTPRTVLPKYFQIIYVNEVDNKTLQPGLTDIITQKIKDKFAQDSRLQVTEYVSKANGIIFCTLTEYKKIPLTYTAAGEIDTSALTMGVQMVVKDIKSDAELHNKFIEQTIRFNFKSAPIETELDAQKRLIESLSDKIVSTTIEGW